MYVCFFVPKTRFQHKYIENSHENMFFFILWFGVVGSPWKEHLMLTSPYFHNLDVRSSHTNGLNPKGPWMRHFVFDSGIQLKHVEWTVTNSDRWKTFWFIERQGFKNLCNMPNTFLSLIFSTFGYQCNCRCHWCCVGNTGKWITSVIILSSWLSSSCMCLKWVMSIMQLTQCGPWLTPSFIIVFWQQTW
jgi:hypothetical protein